MTSRSPTVRTAALPAATSSPEPPWISAAGRGVDRPPTTSGHTGTTRHRSSSASRTVRLAARPSWLQGTPRRHAETRIAGFSAATAASLCSSAVSADPDFQPALDALARARDAGWHDGAQLYVSRYGAPLLDVATGEAAPGRARRTDDVMLWYSSSKPATTVAVLQLWERGLLGLDDRIGDFVHGWGGGKERCTVRHVLTHTGGFPMRREGLSERDLPYSERVRLIADHPAESEPGTRAEYHLTTGWTVLGAVVEAVDGRPVKQYVEEEVFARAGMEGCHLGVPEDVQEDLGDRLVPVRWRGHQMPVRRDGRVVMVDDDVEARGHNEPRYRARVEPGSSGHGPANQLGRFYECLLGCGPLLLEPRTVEAMAAVHRYGMRDATFGNLKLPWGLGVQVSGAMSGGPGRRAFGHSGMASSRGFADPDTGLVAVLVTDGLPAPIDNEQRLHEVTDAVYRAFGDELEPWRRPARAPKDTASSS